jgi:AraC-like DNA-binding protein
MRAVIRSYGGHSNRTRHSFAQLVLPLDGSLELDIDGWGDKLKSGRVAFVDQNTDHAEYALGRNRFLVVDLEPALIDPPLREAMARKHFLPLPSPARYLVDFMRVSCQQGNVSSELVTQWAPLLCASLMTRRAGHDDGRLSALMDAIEVNPGGIWTTMVMARLAGVSPSRLHALFREHTGLSPRAWVNAERIRQLRLWMEGTSESLATLAIRAGFCDQSAMTRAFQRETGMTPGAFRRANS